MDFHGKIEKVSFPPSLKPLFDAMLEGKTIKSVTCIGGTINESNRSKDFTIQDFKVTDYW